MDVKKGCKGAFFLYIFTFFDEKVEMSDLFIIFVD